MAQVRDNACNSVRRFNSSASAQITRCPYASRHTCTQPTFIQRRIVSRLTFSRFARLHGRYSSTPRPCVLPSRPRRTAPIPPRAISPNWRQVAVKLASTARVRPPRSLPKNSSTCDQSQTAGSPLGRVVDRRRGWFVRWRARPRWSVARKVRVRDHGDLFDVGMVSSGDRTPRASIPCKKAFHQTNTDSYVALGVGSITLKVMEKTVAH